MLIEPQLVGRSKNYYQDKLGNWFYKTNKMKFPSRCHLVKCEFCGEEHPRRIKIKNETGKFYCSKSCSSRDINTFGNLRGDKHYNWTGGRIINAKGYALIYFPDYPGRKVNGKYVREHRLVMEQKLGRYLKPTEQVHHKNGIKDDNRLRNLDLVTFNDHFGQVTCPCCNYKFKVK